MEKDSVKRLFAGVADHAGFPLIHKVLAACVGAIGILLPVSATGDGGGFGAGSALVGPAAWVGSGKTLSIDPVASMYQGPAGIARDSITALALTYSKPYSGIDGFNLGSFDGVTTWRGWGIGASYNHFEVTGFREATSTGALTGRTFDARDQTARLTLARPIGTRFGLGGAVHYGNITIRDRSTGRFGIDLGAEYRSNRFIATTVLKNLSGSRSGPDALPLIGEAGIEWRPWRQLHLGGTISYQESANTEFRIGVKYDFWGPVSLTAGYDRTSDQWSGGGVFRYQNINFQYAAMFHKELETTHLGTLGVEF